MCVTNSPVNVFVYFYLFFLFIGNHVVYTYRVTKLLRPLFGLNYNLRDF